MRAPMAFYGSTFRRVRTYHAGMQTTSRPSRTPSTRDPVRPWDGELQRKPLQSTYTRFNRLVLRPPIESAQYTSVRFGETLALSGLIPSIGTVGDAFDNALA